MCCNVFNMWPKTTLVLPVWPRDAKRLDTSMSLRTLKWQVCDPFLEMIKYRIGDQTDH